MTLNENQSISSGQPFIIVILKMIHASLEHFRWLKLTALVGLSLWLVAVSTVPTPQEVDFDSANQSSSFDQLKESAYAANQGEYLLLFQVLVLCPLLLILVLSIQAPKKSSLINYVVQLLHPFAALALLIGYYLKVRSHATIFFTSCWLIFCILVSWMSCTHLVQLFKDRKLHRHNWCLCIGLLYLFVSGLWIFFSEYGLLNVIGFNRYQMLLQALHYMYGGFSLSTMGGLVFYGIHSHRKSNVGVYNQAIKEPYSTLMFVVCLGTILGTPLVTLGVISSEPMELFTVFIFSGTQLVLSFICLGMLIPNISRPGVKLLLVVSSLSLIITAVLSLVNAAARILDSSIEIAIAIHGWLNGIGFVLCGSLGWMIWLNEKRTMLKDISPIAD